MRTSERRREDTKEEASPEPYELPPDIIGEILIRLPAKSIGIFRRVSKLFRSLSSDQRFAKRHLDLTVRNDSVHRRFLLYYFRSIYAVSFASLGLIADKLNYPLESNQINCVDIVGSCNGLVCISPVMDVMLLYNPTTGESKRLPVSVPLRSEGFQTYGFGFDDITNDYKVVKLVADAGADLVSASVYSLKANSWRWIRDLSYEYWYALHSGVNLNGACHWVFSLHEGGKEKRVVLAFDIKTEEFREMPLPDVAEYCPHGFRELVVGNLNGRLCVMNRCYRKHDEVWVMNEYGVASSWSKIRIGLFFRSMKPLWSTNNNSEEVLLQLDDEMVLYNFETNEWMKLPIHGVKLSNKFEAITYVQSLVSPNSYGGVEN